MCEFHIHEIDRSLHGHGQVICYSSPCGLPDAGMVIESVDPGFGVDALTQAQVDWLLTQAALHQEQHAGHDVRCYTFERDCEPYVNPYRTNG